MSLVDRSSMYLIEHAALGEAACRSEFYRRYGDPVRAYLAGRWRGSPWIGELEDAVQEVFIECFKPDGVIERFGPPRGEGFRPFLFGAVRHVAQRFERAAAQRHARQAGSSVFLEDLPLREPTLSRLFDRTWAQTLMKEAGRLMRQRAEALGPDALRRVDLLELRFQEGLAPREIAVRWGIEAQTVRRAYARARDEFERALRDTLRDQLNIEDGSLERACQELYDLLR